MAPCQPENAVSAAEGPRRRAGSPTCVPSHRGAHAPFQRGPRAAVRQPCWRPTSTVPYRGAHDPTRGAQGAAARLATPLLQRGSGAAAETTRSYTVGPLGDAYGSRGRPGRAGSHRGAHQRGLGCGDGPPFGPHGDGAGATPPLSLSLSLRARHLTGQAQHAGHVSQTGRTCTDGAAQKQTAHRSPTQQTACCCVVLRLI